MICENYGNLIPVERVEFIGKLAHAAMSSNSIFDSAKKLIEDAESLGLFNGVKILPINEQKEPTDSV